MLALITAGFAAVLNIKSILLIAGGVLLGIVFGSIPGLSATMAIALCLPMTYGMDPMNGMSLLVALYIGGISGGLVAAILLRIPGTPSSVATCFDGYPLAARGEAGKALGVGIFFSFLGTIFGVAVLMLVSPIVARFALKFSFYEYFAVGVFSLTMMAGLISGSIVKGLASGAIGLLFAMVGSAPIDGLPRLTFGFHALDGGFNILPVLIGMFAISEIIKSARERNAKKAVILQNFKIKGFGFTFQEFVSQIPNFFRSAAIGTAIGILPGIGGGTSNILSYTAAKNSSRHPELFGTGIIDGIVASESANNATIGGALVPLLTLGIPGDAATALLLGGLTIHGLNPGPLLFDKEAELVYGIFAICLIANLMMLLLEYGGIKVFARILNVPKYILMPIILVLCVVGAYGLNNRLFDVWAILFFGVVAYVLEKAKFPLTPIILGFILGPTIETNLRRGLIASKGSWVPFFTHPISLFFLTVSVIVIALAAVREVRLSKKKEEHNRK